nr:hypothetical protein [Halomonas elongata]
MANLLSANDDSIRACPTALPEPAGSEQTIATNVPQPVKRRGVGRSTDPLKAREHNTHRLTVECHIKSWRNVKQHYLIHTPPQQMSPKSSNISEFAGIIARTHTPIALVGNIVQKKNEITYTKKFCGRS